LKTNRQGEKMNWHNFVECQNWGMNALTVSAIGTVFFTFWQLYAACVQSKKVWSEKSAQSVSLQLFTYNLFYLVTFLIYGAYKNSLAIMINGLLFIAFLPAVIGIWKFKKTKLREKIIALLYSLIIPAMIILPQKDLVVLASLSGIALFLVIQLWDIIREGDFGALSVEFIVIYLATNAFWLAFSITIKNVPMVLFSAVVIVIYSVCLYLFFRYKKIDSTREKKKKSN